jgi:diguanylate cyclase (GGDEF)-like protein
MQPTDIDTLISQSEVARDSGRLAEGLAMAEPAWLALGADNAPARRRLGLVLLHLRYRSGDLSKAVELADDLLPLLRASGPTTELIDTLRTVSLCSADTNRFAMSLSCAQEAHRLSLDIGDAARLSLSTNALACFFERSGDPWQAERLMLESLSLARQAGDAYATRVALNNTGAALIGKFYLLRDAMPTEQAADSLRLARPFVEESVVLARASGEVFFQVFALGNLSEILVHLGEAEPAAQLLDEALTMARPLGFEAQVWRMGCTQGELLLLLQQPQAAWDQLVQVLKAAAQADQRTTHMRLHHALWRAAAQLGRSADALHHLQAYLALERARAVTQLQAQSDLFITRMEAEQVRQDAQRHRARATALEADVRRDQLTGLGNRREMEARWPELIREARASGQPLSVAMLDLDHFKQVNDMHGHAVGDQVLVTLGGLLRTQTRGSDLVARMGGEEFLVVLPDTDAERAADVCERLRQRVAGHDWATLAPGLRVTLSIGLTTSPPVEAQTLSLRADAALYHAKAAGRNRLVQI